MLYEHPVYVPKGHYADNKQLLDSMEYADVPHDQMPHSPGIKKTAVGQAMTFGDVAPNAVSQEPKGLPRRHPGPDRLAGLGGPGPEHVANHGLAGRGWQGGGGGGVRACARARARVCEWGGQ